MLADLDRTARAKGIEPCLIGAGAIQLGPDKRWSMRLARTTKDLDFAVRVDSWEHYEELASALVESGGFSRTPVAHRFPHVRGGLLDIVPYGGLERPPGRIEWPSGTEMNTTGMGVLDQHHHMLHIDSLELRTASRPAVVGLKLLAYLDRRPGILRDIQDVYALIRGADDCVLDDRVLAECLPQLAAETVSYGEIGAYLLGRDVGAIFRNGELSSAIALLEVLDDRLVDDVFDPRDPVEASRERVVERLKAFRTGLQGR